MHSRSLLRLALAVLFAVGLIVVDQAPPAQLIAPPVDLLPRLNLGGSHDSPTNRIRAGSR